jgi:hypothetical protein
VAAYAPDQAHPGTTSINLINVSDGASRARLFPLPHRLAGLQPAGMSRAAMGHVWVTLTRGPHDRSDVASGDPAPHSCAGRVVDISIPSGAHHVVMRAGDNELIGDAQRSPDGSRLAYLDGGCTNSSENQWIRVVNLHTRRSVTIGRGVAPCHTIAGLRWTADSTHLVVTYGAVDPSAHPPGDGVGMCNESLANQLVVVRATATQAALTGPSARPDPTCEFVDATATATGYAGLENCEVPPPPGVTTGHTYVNGLVQLVRFDDRLQATVRAPLGRCGNSGEITADPDGTQLLIVTPQHCPDTNDPSLAHIFTVDGAKAPVARFTWPSSASYYPTSIVW